MRLDENRKIAWVVLAACVLLSVFALGGGALGRERGKVLKVFNDGIDDSSVSSRSSMDAYLDDAGECVQAMVGEYEIYLGESALGNQALSNAGQIGDDKASLDTRYQCYTDLKGQVEKLYSNLNTAVSESEFKNFKLAHKDFKGDVDLIEKDDYHTLAKSYNNLISGVPGALVAGVTGNGALNTFGG